MCEYYEDIDTNLWGIQYDVVADKEHIRELRRVQGIIAETEAEIARVQLRIDKLTVDKTDAEHTETRLDTMFLLWSEQKIADAESALEAESL